MARKSLVPSLETVTVPCLPPGAALDFGDPLGPCFPASWRAGEERHNQTRGLPRRAFHLEMRRKDTQQGKVAQGARGGAPAPARAANASTLRKEQLQSCRSTLYLFYGSKRTFSSISKRSWRGGGEGRGEGVASLPRMPPSRFRSSKLLPLPKGWTPEVRFGDPAVSLRRGREPGRAGSRRPRETARPAEP